MADETSNDLLALTSEIVSAHVANNSVHAGEVPNLIKSVYDAMSGLGSAPAAAEPEKPQGAVSARKSLGSPDHIISMIDGKPYKMLRRHISLHGHTPESYREAYGLARDYPMVAANYAEQRRALAHKIGLGRKPKAEVAAEPAKAPARRGRKPKALGDAIDAAKGHLGGE